MLYEFALLPDVIEEAVTSSHESNQRELVSLLTRLRENGMLVDMGNGEWHRYVSGLLMQSGGTYLSEIMNRLSDLHDRGRIVAHGAGTRTSKIDWVAEANDARNRCNFYGIIVSQEEFNRLAGPTNGYFPFPASPSPSAAWQKWQGKRSQRTRKCRSDFESVLAPVFRHAQRVHLVDPYFNCHRPEYCETFNLCINLLMDGTARHPELFIHAGDPERDRQHNPETAQARAQAWRSYLNSVSIRRPMTFRVYLWGNNLPERIYFRRSQVELFQRFGT